MVRLRLRFDPFCRKAGLSCLAGLLGSGIFRFLGQDHIDRIGITSNATVMRV